MISPQQQAGRIGKVRRLARANLQAAKRTATDYLAVCRQCGKEINGSLKDLEDHKNVCRKSHN